MTQEDGRASGRGNAAFTFRRGGHDECVERRGWTCTGKMGQSVALLVVSSSIGDTPARPHMHEAHANTLSLSSSRALPAKPGIPQPEPSRENSQHGTNCSSRGEGMRGGGCPPAALRTDHARTTQHTYVVVVGMKWRPHCSFDKSRVSTHGNTCMYGTQA